MLFGVSMPSLMTIFITTSRFSERLFIISFAILIFALLLLYLVRDKAVGAARATKIIVLLMINN
jgi:type II secretory pathway component PulF